jgi:hypothetical protein
VYELEFSSGRSCLLDMDGCCVHFISGTVCTHGSEQYLDTGNTMLAHPLGVMAPKRTWLCGVACRIRHHSPRSAACGGEKEDETHWLIANLMACLLPTSSGGLKMRTGCNAHASKIGQPCITPRNCGLCRSWRSSWIVSIYIHDRGLASK